MLHSKFPCMHSYSTSDVIGVHEDNDSYVFKKFINAAIYVEKSIKKLGPDHTSHSENMKIKKTKRCTCTVDAYSCSFHNSVSSGDSIKYTKSENLINCNNGNVHQQSTGRSNDKLIEIRERQRAINTRRIVSAYSMRSNHELFETRDSTKYLDRKLENLEEEISPKSVPSETELPDPNNTRCQRKIQEVEENIAAPKKKVEAVLPRVSENQPENRKIDAIQEVKEITDTESNSSSPSSSTLTGSTVKMVDISKNNNTKFSLSSMTSCRLSENESVKQWLTRKLEEQKKRRINLLNEKKRKEIERQKILEKERENFKLWLAEKKKIEEKQRVQLQKQQQWESLQMLKLEEKHIQSQIEYENWLRKKRFQKMEKENKEHQKAMQNKIDKERRVLVNQEIFEEWLKTAKHKPKPIPLNRGLDSLRSSVSVTYINPVPWVPNIEQKPASQ